jgi:radical SAM superfamily enzyme YgiQ (UPF0313 family)
METAQTIVVLEKNGKPIQVEATRIQFSAHQCLAFDDGPDDLRCLRLLSDHFTSLPGLAVAIDTDDRLLKYLVRHFPWLRDRIRCVIVEKIPADGHTDWNGIPIALADEAPDDVQTVFLCETRAFARMRTRGWLKVAARIIDMDVLADLALEQLPARAWAPRARDTIYPIDVPNIEFRAGLDILVIDCPARNLGLMPNGLGYVHNALKQIDVRYQTCDLDILLYHRFHIRRLFDEGGIIRLPSGRELPTDPWQAEHYDLWADAEVLAYFETEIQEIVDKLLAARPKVLGLSIHACNEKFSLAVVERVKAAAPEIVILVGGFSCYSPDIGLRAFPLADYMCVGEADLTVGPLVERLAKGERPANIPGVLSRFDKRYPPFLPAPMVHDLDLLDHPRYEWYDLSVYRNYNGYQLTPVIASRGCRWSRCTFCAERFYWRIRSAKSFVDELEWLVSQGCRLFMFNESDLNGKPEALLEICDEVLRRGLRIKLTGQLRIHMKCNRAYFQKLHDAGFVALRFGVDAFSENALRLQKKGYTTATVSQNLRDCWEAGIYTEVNWVIGVPGETEKDIEEGIELILRNKPYIGRLANINPLILSTGSVYWMEPEKHNIQFRGAKDELYQNHPRAIPACLWYSTEPLIDEKVRKRRFERIVLALRDGGFDVGAWANRIIEDVKHNRDSIRSGPRDESEDIREGPKLSAGVGGMEKPEPQEHAALEFNPDARSAAYVFRAGSSLPEDKTHYFKTDLIVVAKAGELFGIEAPLFQTALGTRPATALASEPRTIDMRLSCKVLFAKTKSAIPELIQSVGNYNVVSYDGTYYGLPQNLDPACYQLVQQQLQENGFIAKEGVLHLGLWKIGKILAKSILVFMGLRKRSPVPLAPSCPIPWGDVNIAGLPGVITGSNLSQVIAEIENRLGLNKPHVEGPPQSSERPRSAALPLVNAPLALRPQLVGSLDGYRVVEYEGWFYGLPQTLGDIDLRQVDVLEMPGVIRDLSRQVVEDEIRDLSQGAADSETSAKQATGS